MHCAEIEELILSYSELESEQRELVDAHARGCEACSDYLGASREVDLALQREVKAPSRLQIEVLARIAPGPSYLPEIFDFVGWAAMITVVVGLIDEFVATYIF